VKAIDREKDVAEFVRSADLLIPAADAKNVSTTVFELPPPNRDPQSIRRLFGEEVEKEGLLQRQGKVIASNWKDIHCSISKSGFFHYFADEKATVPEFSVQLNDCIVSPAPTIHKDAFEIEQPNSNFFSLTGTPNKYYFKANSTELLTEWLAAFRKHTAPVFRPSSPRAPAASAVAGAGGGAGTGAGAGGGRDHKRDSKQQLHHPSHSQAQAHSHPAANTSVLGASLKPPPPAGSAHTSPIRSSGSPLATAYPTPPPHVKQDHVQHALHTPKNPLQSPLHKSGSDQDLAAMDRDIRATPAAVSIAGPTTAPQTTRNLHT